MSLSTGHCAIKRISLSKTSWFYSHWINIYPMVCLRQVRSPNISHLTNKPRWGNQIMCSFFFCVVSLKPRKQFFFVSQFRFVLWLYYFVTFGFWEILLWLQHSSFETVRKISKHINDYLLYCSNRFSFSLLVFMLLLVLPSAEPKVPPEGFFFKVVEQANAIFHLLEKHFTDCVIGLVA